MGMPVIPNRRREVAERVEIDRLVEELGLIRQNAVPSGVLTLYSEEEIGKFREAWEKATNRVEPEKKEIVKATIFERLEMYGGKIYP